MPGTAPASHQFALVAELIVLFVLLPIAFRYKPFPFPPIPALWLLMAYCLFRLLHDPAFDRKRLWNPAALPATAAHILIAFAVVAVLVVAGVYFLAPQRMFNFVRRAPAFWTLVMCLYPVLSVYPQGIIYRAFFFERYRGLFPNTAALIVASAVAFSFAHIIFRNPIALSFTLAGGLLFAWRYAQTGSLFTSAVEHALYGCWMFTIGLGEFFYREYGDYATLSFYKGVY
jgi:membrane protease YdiL (CAAX protease family)